MINKHVIMWNVLCVRHTIVPILQKAEGRRAKEAGWGHPAEGLHCKGNSRNSEEKRRQHL